MCIILKVPNFAPFDVTFIKETIQFGKKANFSLDICTLYRHIM